MSYLFSIQVTLKFWELAAKLGGPDGPDERNHEKQWKSGFHVFVAGYRSLFRGACGNVVGCKRAG